MQRTTYNLPSLPSIPTSRKNGNRKPASALTEQMVTALRPKNSFYHSSQDLNRIVLIEEAVLQTESPG